MTGSTSPDTNGNKAWQTMSFVGQLLRFGTPILIMALGYLYTRDQEIERQRDSQMVEAIKGNSELMRELDKELRGVGYLLAERGVELRGLKEDILFNSERIDRHEIRIRSLELDSRDNRNGGSDSD